MSKNEIGFKIILNYSYEDYKYPYSSIFSPLKIKYVIGKKTYRDINSGALAVFNNYNNAIFFFDRFDNKYWKIIKCEYKPESNVKSKHFFCYYSPIKEKYRKYNANSSPIGTIFARWVKLIEDVTPNNEDDN